MTDLNLALRSLAKSPAFAVISILTLALGIGANTAIFSVVNALLLAPLPYPDSDRIVSLFSSNPKVNRTGAGFAPADYRSFEKQTQSFEALAAARYDYASLTGVDQPTQVTGGMVTVDYFKILGTTPQIGRTFLPEDLQAGRSPAVVVSHSFWENQLGKKPEVVGQTITLDGTAHTVVGVMPSTFKEPFNNAVLWRLFPAEGGENLGATARYWGVLGKLKVGVSAESARAEANVIQSRFLAANPKFHEGWEIAVNPLRDTVVGNYRRGLVLLIGASGLVLLITCANVAGLMLVRAAGRMKEAAIRTALGAGRWRLIRQQLAESSVLLALGCLGGVILGRWGLAMILAGMPAGWLPRGDEVRLSLTVLTVCVAVALVVGLLFSLLPALQSARVDANDALKDGTRGSSGPAAQRLRSALVVGQIALAIVLLTAAGLVIKSFSAIMRVNPGVRPDNVLSMVLTIQTKQFDTPQKQVDYFRAVVDRAKSVPGVDAVALTQTMPFVWGIPASFVVVGRAEEAEKLPQPLYDSVTPSYFQTMGVPLLAGRNFAETDDLKAPRVIMISQALAKRFFPNEDPIGKRLQLESVRQPVPMEIIGVVGDVPRNGLNSPVPYQVYASINQRPFGFASLLVRSAQPVETLTNNIRQEVWKLNPDQPINQVSTVRTLMKNTVAQPQLYTVIFGLFALLALLLAAIGLYGLIAYGVAQRARELGIRAALGAQAGDLLRMICGQAAKLTAIGLAVGLVAAVSTVRLMEALLFQTAVYDPVVFGIVVTTLALVSLAASLLPAWRATKVDPLVALRSE